MLEGSRGELNEIQWAAVQHAEAMTQDVEVPKETFDRLRQWLNDRHMVEITATVAASNCASRFLVALNVGEFDHHD